MHPSRLLLVAALMLLGCAHKPHPGEELTSACRVENDRKEVSASGYLQAPILIGCEHGSCRFQLTPKRSGTYDLGIEIPVGSGPGTMTPLSPAKHDPIPGQITAEHVSVNIRDADGVSVSVHDVVRVTGKMNAYQGSDGRVQCMLEVKKLERL